MTMFDWLPGLFKSGGWLDHWQTLETGGFAMLAAVVAYAAGVIQARATRKAASKQVDAMGAAAKEQVDAADRQVAAANEQLAYAKESERQRRSSAIEGLRMGLSVDAARLKMEANTILQRGVSGGAVPSERYVIAQANMLRLTVDVGHNPDLDALLDKATVAAARDAAARVHQYNAILLRGVTSGFSDLELPEHLTRLVAACDKLQADIGSH